MHFALHQPLLLSKYLQWDPRRENTLTSIEGENIILHDTDNIASTKVTIPQVETLMEEVCPPMSMEEEDYSNDAILAPLRTLMDIDTVVVPQWVLSSTRPVVAETSAERVLSRKPKAHTEDTLRTN
jgi:hypothetical protein